MNSRPTVIELFCGAGGTSVGFSQAGFDVRLGLDMDFEALDTFSRNHPGAAISHDLVEQVTGAELLSKAGLTTVDFLIGGPSCQGYSTIGKRIVDDPRNTLFTHYIRLVSEMRPRWLLFENVRGMVHSGGGRFFDQLLESFADLGYRTTHAVLNAADYGVPQRRERLFVLGSLEQEAPTFPKPLFEDPRCLWCSRPDKSNRVRQKRVTDDLDLFSEGECSRCGGTGFEPKGQIQRPAWISAWDAISDLPRLGENGGTDDWKPYPGEPLSDYQRAIRQGSEGYTLHRARPVSAFAKSLIARIPEGFGVRAIPEHELPMRFREMRRVSSGSLRRDCTTLYHRLARWLPAYTITCYSSNVSSGAFTHPLEDRAITVREAARLQSFPDAFDLNPRNVRRHLGNAVPPEMARVIAAHVLALSRPGVRRQPAPLQHS